MTAPDAMKLLKEKCLELGQAEVARRIGLSPATINRILHDNYPDAAHVLRRVVEVFGGLSVDCPVLRNISLAQCAVYRKRGPTSDSFFARMYHACKNCEQNR